MDFKNKIVRDLNFVIFSNSLLDFDQSCHSILFGLEKARVESWLSSLDQDPEFLQEFIFQNNSIRLGKYFENLLRFYFDWNEKINVVDYSRQLFNNKETLGELDFILRIQNEGYLHLEVAVKYFVKRPMFCDYQNFICPNGERNLKQKVDKTLHGQLKLLENQAGKDYLLSKGIDQIKSMVLIRGAIFYFEDEMKFYCDELAFTENHQRYFASYFDKFTFDEKCKYKLLKNHYWLTQNIYTSSKDLHSRDEILHYLSEQFSNSTKGWVLGEYQLVNGKFVETKKIALLHNSWPLF